MSFWMRIAQSHKGTRPWVRVRARARARARVGVGVGLGLGLERQATRRCRAALGGLRGSPEARNDLRLGEAFALREAIDPAPDGGERRSRPLRPAGRLRRVKVRVRVRVRVKGEGEGEA